MSSGVGCEFEPTLSSQFRRCKHCGQVQRRNGNTWVDCEPPVWRDTSTQGELSRMRKWALGQRREALLSKARADLKNYWR